jgi:taurine dioxygenase
VRRALLAHQVLFFRDQLEIAPDVQIQMGRMFGELHFHPAAPQMDSYPEIFEIHVHKNSRIANGEFWHSDVSCDEIPPLGTILQLHILPEIGGDTLFANMYAAYETLSPPLKSMLGSLTALHGSEHVYRGRYSDRGVDDAGKNYPQALHPVVRTHPETGRKALYVNRTFTTRINELSEHESSAMLGFLFDHSEQIDFQIRFRWERNDVAFWDNRCVMHRAVWDYWPEERKGRRVTIKGDRPR